MEVDHQQLFCSVIDMGIEEQIDCAVGCYSLYYKEGKSHMLVGDNSLL